MNNDVKRYQSHEIVHNFSQGTATGPYVLASDHDRIVAERDKAFAAVGAVARDRLNEIATQAKVIEKLREQRDEEFRTNDNSHWASVQAMDAEIAKLEGGT